ncbi:alpha/beta hydrolase [Bacillus infantis]|uniref:alpha/beta fold hydrolase n=1 Tax=Bacillus infantis TaxID=324767 RepID=UPI001CD64656|nr:alpha/beta hydrolase [Bacillus infantis]MCA1038494.1 alpha/beta hydrolase [Bacillus infantis]
MKEEKILLPNGISMNVVHSLSEKPAILFLHFSGGTWQAWHGVIPHFSAEYSVIAPDIRGHGKSEKPESGYHIDEMAEDIILLLNGLGIECCHIIGSSMGAEVGLSIAASHPEMVKSLVCEGGLYDRWGEYSLIDGTKEEADIERTELLASIINEEELVFSSAEEYLSSMEKEFKEAEIWNRHAEAFSRSTMEQRGKGQFANRFKKNVLAGFISSCWDIRLEDYYRKMSCPVLFLPSQEESEDRLAEKSIKHFSSLLREYYKIYIPNSLHAYVWLQFPFQAAEAVKSFYKSLKTGRLSV